MQSSNFFNTNIASTYGTSKYSVQDVVTFTEKKEILLEVTKSNLTNNEIYRTFFLIKAIDKLNKLEFIN